ncbi:MAG: hypothetical protein F083_867 [bacterium F083]|nr:MAG: hypothetical protein F083_867 [bacterium F083]
MLLGLLLTLGNLYAQEKGQFMLQAEANAGILFCYPYQGTFNSIDLFGSIGPVFRYQVGEHLGIGLGANYCLHECFQYLPVFADAKYSFGTGKTRPYAEIRAGYAFRLKYVKHENGDPNWYSVEGFYSQFIVGYSIGHSDLGIGGQLVNMKTFVNELVDVLPGGCYAFSKNRLQPAVFLQYAYNFHFRK